MMKVRFFLFFLTCSIRLSSQHNNEPLISVHDTISNTYGFVNLKNEQILPFGLYAYVYSDTLIDFAFVRDLEFRLVAITREGAVLFEVFEFDNGPDFPSNGLFRIVANGKIGYADEQTFEIVIQPQFECARPFMNGRAEVSYSCTRSFTNEYEYWESKTWIFIGKDGKQINP